jgi:hypothetical protein
MVGSENILVCFIRFQDHIYAEERQYHSTKVDPEDYSLFGSVCFFLR